jgi:hypothetical protein
MAKYNRRQARILVDVETRRVKVTDENGEEPKPVGIEQTKRLYKDGLVFVGAIYQHKRNPSTCIIVNVGGTTYKICE